MILTYEQLKQTNLKGYKFFETYEGYTRTGWGTIDDNYVVIEDDGENCVVAYMNDRDRTKCWSKDTVASKIARKPFIEWSNEKNMSVNAIEKI